MDLELLREWVRAEIDYAMARNEPEADGYSSSAILEREIASTLFAELVLKEINDD